MAHGSVQVLRRFANLYSPTVHERFKVSFESVSPIAEKTFIEKKVKLNQTEIKYHSYVGIGNWAQIDDGQPSDVDSMEEGFDVTIYNYEYKKRIIANQQMVEKDDEDGLIIDQVSEAGLYAALTFQETCANILNDGFTANAGGDGEYLFASAHPYPDESDASGTQDNAATTTLSDTNLRAGRVALLGQLNDRGKRYLNPTATIILAVPPELTDLALILTKTRTKPETANLSINVNEGRYVVVEWPQLTSATAWFLIHPQSGLRYQMRVKPGFANAVIDTNLWQVSWSGRGSWGAGFRDWRGAWGSTG